MESTRELPNGWAEVKIEDVCKKISNGGNFNQKDSIGGLPVTRIETISYEEIDLSRVKYCCDYSESDVDKYRLQFGDILFSNINSDFHLGKTAIFKDKREIILHGINLLRIQTYENISPFFLNLIFKHLRYKGVFIKLGHKAVNQSSINQTKIKQISFPLPPLLEQHRIVAKIEELFSELDKGMESLKTAQHQLKLYRQAVLMWAFEGKLTEKWRKVQKGLPTVEELVDQINKEREKKTKESGKKPKEFDKILEEEKNTLPVVPPIWGWLRLKVITEIVGGITKGRNFNNRETIKLPYLRVANVQDGYLDLREMKEIELLEGEKEKYLLKENDILYTEGGDKDKLGRGTIWKNEIFECVHQNHIFRARTYGGSIVPKFVSYFSQTETAKNYFYKRAKQTVNLASINMTVLGNLPVPIPSKTEQVQIVQEIESRLSVCDKMKESITQSLAQAETLRQSILKKAFEGKLVPQDPNDEPPTILLERIRSERETQKPEKKPGKRGTQK